MWGPKIIWKNMLMSLDGCCSGNHAKELTAKFSYFQGQHDNISRDGTNQMWLLCPQWILKDKDQFWPHSSRWLGTSLDLSSTKSSGHALAHGRPTKIPRVSRPSRPVTPSDDRTCTVNGARFSEKLWRHELFEDLRRFLEVWKLQ